MHSHFQSPFSSCRLPSLQGASIRQHWEHKAWQGDLGALYEVAKIYDTGAFGTTPDLAKATEAYKEVGALGGH